MGLEMEFERQKSQRLGHVDMSRKGSIDVALLPSVNLINAMPNYFTTSCCSGRIILFENPSEASLVQKKGCQWLHVTHDFVVLDDLVAALQNLSGEAVMKFEPMIMHVACRDLHDAQLMHQMAVASGFRNSGITVGVRGKIMAAIRSPLCLEVPLSAKGQLLASSQHLEYIVSAANSKMQENNQRIERFYTSLQELSAREVNDPKDDITSDPTGGKHQKDARGRKQNNKQQRHARGRQKKGAKENKRFLVHDKETDVPIPQHSLNQPEHQQNKRPTDPEEEEDGVLPFAMFNDDNI